MKDQKSISMLKVLRFVVATMNRFRGRHIFLWVVIFSLAVSEMLIPYYMGQLVGTVAEYADIPEEGRSIVYQNFALYILFFITFWIMRHASGFVLAYVQSSLMKDLTADGFSKVQSFSTNWHNNSFSGATVREITRGMKAFEQLSDTLYYSIFPTFFVLVSMIGFMTYLYPMIGLVAACFALFFIALSLFISLRVVAPRNRASNEQDSKLGGAIADAVTCNQLVRAYGMEAEEEKRLGGVLEHWRSKTVGAWYAANWNGVMQTAFLISSRFLFVGMGLYLWLSGDAGAGDIAYLIGVSAGMQAWLRDIGMQLRNLQTSSNEMEALMGYLNAKPAIRDVKDAKSLEAKKGAVQFDQVMFRYQPDTPLLYDALTLNIPEGQKVALVGHSGSGKSTFVKLLQRLYDIQGGAITIDGQNIAEVTQRSLRRHIALVPQEPILFHRSLFDNIAYGKDNATLEQVIQAAKNAHAHDFIDKLPMRYDTLVGERGIKLSGGERQRVAIARAMLSDAPLLILDEATSSLDSVSEAFIQKALQRLSANRTTIIIAHRLSTIRDADRILVFKDGQIVEDGHHDALIALENGHYAYLHSVQSDGMIQ